VGKNFERVFEKIIKTKWAGGMAQVVEYLPSKCETLSSKQQQPPKTNNVCHTHA
jgi:hypothetical protein